MTEVPNELLRLARKGCATCQGTGYIVVQVQPVTKGGKRIPITNTRPRRWPFEVNPDSRKPAFIGSPRKDVTAELCGCVEKHRQKLNGGKDVPAAPSVLAQPTEG